MQGSGAARIGVLVVDDQAPVRETLRELVGRTAGMRLLGEATSGEGALREVDRLGPQLVIMDVRMPGLGGIGGTRRLTRAHPGIVVLLVSVDDVDPVAVRTSGAAGF